MYVKNPCSFFFTVHVCIMHVFKIKLFEPCHVIFAYAKTKTQISFAMTAKLISTFVFSIRIVHFLFYLYLKFQASCHLLWLYSPVCVGPGRKPRRPGFSQQGSFNFSLFFCLHKTRYTDKIHDNISNMLNVEHLQAIKIFGRSVEKIM